MIPKPINFSLQQKRAKKIAKILSEKSHDLIFLQEVFSPASRRKIRKALKRTHPFQYELNTDSRFPHILGSGLMVMSKYPMKVLDKVYFSTCAQTDCAASKGSMLVEVDLGDGDKLHAASTHLQAWEDDRAVQVRQIQLKSIDSMLRRHQQSHIPQILIGDLNIDGKLQDEFSTALDLLEMTSDPLVGDLDATNGFKVSCYKIPGDSSVGQWLDHLWINPMDTNTRVSWRKVLPISGKIRNKECPLSDHHALESEIEI